MMIFSSVYSVVDGFFISNFAGETPFAAVNLIYPFLMILSTVGFMFGAGGTAIVANTLGRGHRKRANRFFSFIVYAAIFLGVIMALSGILFITPISRMLGADGELLKDCIIYGFINLIALPFFILQLLFQSFLVTAEKPDIGLKVTITAGLTNMLLDALLVILLPQEYKLAGAAIATALSQFVAGAVPLIYFSRENDSLLRLGKTKFYGWVLIKACTNGSSEFMSNISMSLVGMLYNFQLMRLAGESGIAAYGVMMYVSMIFSAAFIGYSTGVAPVIGFHDGAGNNKELLGILRQSLIIIGCFGISMLVASELLARPLTLIFASYDHDLLEMTVHGFRIFSISFIFMGFAVFGSAFFTALNDGLTSALISFLRTLVFEMGAVLILPTIFGLDGIWASVIVAEFMAASLSMLFILRRRKKYVTVHPGQ